MAGSDKLKIAAIVPALDEESNVGEVLKILLNSKAFDEVILVDDGSVDKTPEIGEKLGAKVIRLPKIGGSGKGNAMKQGSKASNAKIIVFFDADLIGLTHDHISLLIEPMLKENIAMCVGIRGRLLGLPSLIARLDPLMAIGGERAVKKDLFDGLSDKFIQGFSVESALNYYCLKKRLAVKYVILKNLKVITKEEKRGLLNGFASRIEMIFEIIWMRLLLPFVRNEFIQGNKTK